MTGMACNRDGAALAREIKERTLWPSERRLQNGLRQAMGSAMEAVYE